MQTSRKNVGGGAEKKQQMNDNALKLTAKPEEGPWTTTSVNTTGIPCLRMQI